MKNESNINDSFYLNKINIKRDNYEILPLSISIGWIVFLLTEGNQGGMTGVQGFCLGFIISFSLLVFFIWRYSVHREYLDLRIKKLKEEKSTELNKKKKVSLLIEKESKQKKTL